MRPRDRALRSRALVSEGSVPISEWLSTFVPLGTYSDDAWSPVGAGVLIVDLPVVWLVTSKALVESLKGAPAAAFISHAEGATILDLSEGHAKSGLGWIEHEELDLVASLFPMSPAWNIKAFTQQQCVPIEQLTELMPVASLGCPYGAVPGERPQPFLLAGAIASLNAPLIHSTAPLLPKNVGGPLVQGAAGDTIRLAGVMTRTLFISDADPRIPPIRITEAVGMEAVWDLVRGDEARAQRKKVVETGA